MLNYNIELCNQDDHGLILEKHQEAILFQNKNSIQSWLALDPDLLLSEIQKNYYYKVYRDKDIIGLFKLLHEDYVIWGEREDQLAIYLHGIISVHRNKGSLFPIILNWSSVYVKKISRKHIRMDTWTNNPKLIQYYQSFGFEILDQTQAAHPELLHSCYSSTSLTLLQYHVV